MNRVLLIVVDGCTPRILGPAIERGELPLIGRLAASGWLALNGISVFPSITPAATASIVTGEYPSRHGIAGMSWWNPSTHDVSYFGDDVSTVLKRGVGSFLRDFLLRLNGDRLKAPTLFQLVERQRKRAACFNHLIFRGDVVHEVTHPWVLRALPSIDAGVRVHGPSWLCLGDFVSSTGADEDIAARGGLFNRFGLDDEGTAALLSALPSAAALPDFTVAHFPDYDFDSHEKGPRNALHTLQQLDERLAGFFTHWGGVERVLRDTCIVLTADHSHNEIRPEADAAIELGRVLSDYQMADPASGWQDGDELLVCPNMRSAEIFHREHDGEFERDIAARLLTDPRVDQVIWRDAAEDGGDIFHVVTRDRGALRFRPLSQGASGPTDEYGGRWEIRGDLEALDMTVTGAGVHYGAYPNALERIANGVEAPRVGRIWATARPGSEFAAVGQSVHHGGGSHGTLHEDDSRVPLLVAGALIPASLNVTPRIVDVAPVCCELMGVRCPSSIAASRIGSRDW